jgi:hypothetical protein
VDCVLEANHAFQLNVNAGLFDTLSDGRRVEILARIHLASRQPPAAVARLVHEQKPAGARVSHDAQRQAHRGREVVLLWFCVVWLLHSNLNKKRQFFSRFPEPRDASRSSNDADVRSGGNDDDDDDDDDVVDTARALL